MERGERERFIITTCNCISASVDFTPHRDRSQRLGTWTSANFESCQSVHPRV